MSEWKEIGVILGAPVLIVAVLAAVLLTGLYFANRAECLSRWQDSGMEASFGFFEGCRIKLPDGRRIPAENYREL
jgi:hypothetical protein